ncbi:hypothetical protein V8J36_17940 [Frigidibacter sp. MR17.14]|uniref:hypothetical protein n=1 Tax=Frigidibacter sp. MR17.14 TaxID=3126509 RepID=UPI003013039B
MTAPLSHPRRLLAGALAVGLTLGFATVASSPVLAAGGQPDCAHDSRNPACQKPGNGKPGNGKPAQTAPGRGADTAPGKAPGKGVEHRSDRAAEVAHGPKIGDNGRGGREVKRAKNGRLPVPPAHQHYRVIDDKVVRVDDNTMKIVAIVGLASALLNN